MTYDMLTGRVVVAGMDGTDSGRAALRAAARGAVAAGARLIVLHVRPGPLPMEHLALEAQSLGGQWRDELELEAWAQSAVVLGEFDVDWEFVVRDGDPVRAIGSVARSRSARAVYAGARIRTGWSARLHRCPATGLQRSCPCPVRVVRFPAGSAGSAG
jgi:nucleotide-binding universal stress UspA family protein